MNTALISITTKFFLDNSPIDMSVVDDTNYAGNASVSGGATQIAINHSQVEGIIDARLPNGNLFYDGDATFASPDIDRSATDTKSGIEITLDANDEMIEGDYEVDYTIKVTDERIDFVVKRIIKPATKGQIIIEGDWVDEITDETDLTITTSGGGNNGSYNLDSVSYDSSTDETTVQVTVSLTAEGTGPILELTATREYKITNTYNYNYTATTASILLSVDTDKSELRSEDDTDYSQYDNNTYSSLSHTVHYPVDLIPAKSDVTSSNAIISINPIYTNVFTSEISAVVLITGSDGLIIQDTITGVESVDVVADNKLILIFDALEAVSANFTNAITNGTQSEVKKWGNLWDQIKGWAILYHFARVAANAADQDTYYNLIFNALVASGCSLTPSNSTESAVSVVVQPITSGGLTTIYNELVNQWLTGAGVPSDSIGDDGDFYLKNANPDIGDVYQKAAGIWGSAIMNIAGADGTNGTNGTDGADGADGVGLLFSDANSSSLSGGPFTDQVMPNRTYTMPAGTLSNGDSLQIFTELWRSGFSADGFNVAVGGFDFAVGNPASPNIDPPNDVFYFIIDLMRLNATTLKAFWRFGMSDSLGQAAGLSPVPFGFNISGFNSPGIITIADMDANPTIIALKVTSTSNTFTSQQMRIHQFIS